MIQDIAKNQRRIKAEGCTKEWFVKVNVNTTSRKGFPNFVFVLGYAGQ